MRDNTKISQQLMSEEFIKQASDMLTKGSDIIITISKNGNIKVKKVSITTFYEPKTKE